MASTEQRTGFRLPWGSPSTTETETPAQQADHPTEDAPAASTQQETGTMGTTVAENEAMAATEAAAHDEAVAEVQAGQQAPTPEAAAVPAAAPDPTAAAADPGNAIDPWTARPEPATTPAPAAPPAANRPSSRFLADLVRAMRSTAEENRASLVDGLQSEGKTSIEQIHARSAEEVDSLRRLADEDVAGIKEWSKAEIARIRTETEERIAERRQELELSLEGHAALIEREVEHVQARIAEYEAEMDAFFVRLDQIDDPSEFATVAAEMPEPPSLEEASAAARAAALEELVRETTAGRLASEPVEAVAEQVTPVADPVDAVAEPVTPVADPVDAVAEPSATPGAYEPQTVSRVHAEAAAEAQAPAAEPEPMSLAPVGDAVTAVAVADVEATAPEAQPAEATAASPEMEGAGDLVWPDETRSSDGDPRLAALGLTADAPEAEAPAAEPMIDAMSETTIAARLGDPSPNGRTAPESTTSVVVIGLVSVASVAAFKRTLGKVAGVRSVGVSSGPEGEFVFKTTHDADVALKDVIPTMPGFGARVVAAGDGVVNVSARDPETEA